MKLGAASLTSEDMEAQLLLLTAVKDVASSLGGLIDCTRKASGKSVQDPSMEKLKASAKVRVGGAWWDGRGFNCDLCGSNFMPLFLLFSLHPPTMVSLSVISPTC